MLTSLVFGFSQHDANKFIHEYIENEILPVNPFQSLDTNAVGEMIKRSIKDIKNVNDKIKVIVFIILFLFSNIN
jgi:pyruvate,orthophosphate dikinase